jgi:predicted DNA-binding transcriptional regulator YafY
MARAARLLEMLIRLRGAPRLTARELADEFGVSRRTMQRDLQALADLGVRLVAAPGPGGGYTLARDQRLAPLSLTVDEALGVLLSYDAFARFAQPPFVPESEGLSAATKLRAALPPDVARELERLRDHVALIARPVGDPAPLLGDLLRAALDAAHLRIVYDSKSGRSERIIFPFGIYSPGRMLVLRLPRRKARGQPVVAGRSRHRAHARGGGPRATAAYPAGAVARRGRARRRQRPSAARDGHAAGHAEL